MLPPAICVQMCVRLRSNEALQLTSAIWSKRLCPSRELDPSASLRALHYALAAELRR